MTFDARVLDLLLRYAEMHQRGQPITPEELCRDCPELLEEVQRRLRDLKALQPLLGSTDAVPPVRQPQASPGPEKAEVAPLPTSSATPTEHRTPGRGSGWGADPAEQLWQLWHQ